MPKIVRITQQKKHSNRYNCYLDNDECISVTDDMILKFHLSAGTELQTGDLESIGREVDRVFTREKALELLSLRDHSARELSIKLMQKGYRKPVIDKVIEELRNKRFLDDGRFAGLYAEELIKVKRLGPLLVREKLFSHGISAAETAGVLEAYDSGLQTENCRYHCLKKTRTLKDEDPKKAVEKTVRFLQGKGFAWNIIKAVLDELKDTGYL